jgi:hypothetical protein
MMNIQESHQLSLVSFTMTLEDLAKSQHAPVGLGRAFLRLSWRAVEYRVDPRHGLPKVIWPVRIVLTSWKKDDTDN